MKSAFKFVLCSIAIAGLGTAFADAAAPSKAVQLTDAQLARVVAAGYGTVANHQTGAELSMTDNGGTNGASFLKNVGKVTVCRNC
jgi:hypothetical protein